MTSYGISQELSTCRRAFLISDILELCASGKLLELQTTHEVPVELVELPPRTPRMPWSPPGCIWRNFWDCRRRCPGMVAWVSRWRCPWGAISTNSWDSFLPAISTGIAGDLPVHGIAAAVRSSPRLTWTARPAVRWTSPIPAPGSAPRIATWGSRPALRIFANVWGWIACDSEELHELPW